MNNERNIIYITNRKFYTQTFLIREMVMEDRAWACMATISLSSAMRGWDVTSSESMRGRGKGDVQG